MIRHLKAVYSKEMKSYFRSPMAYILTAIFSGLMGWMFFQYLILANYQPQASIQDKVIFPIFGNMNFVFLILTPLLTMRLFSEESSKETLPLLRYLPVSPWSIILGKYLACMTLVSFMLVVSFVIPVVLSWSGWDNWEVLTTSYLGIFGSTACYVAVGIFASSLTKHQTLAAFLSFCFLFIVMLFVLSANVQSNPLLGQIFQYLSIAFHYEGFVKGVIRNYNIIYYISFSLFFLFLTERSLEARRW